MFGCSHACRTLQQSKRRTGICVAVVPRQNARGDARASRGSIRRYQASSFSKLKTSCRERHRRSFRITHSSSNCEGGPRVLVCFWVELTTTHIATLIRGLSTSHTTDKVAGRIFAYNRYATLYHCHLIDTSRYILITAAYASSLCARYLAITLFQCHLSDTSGTASSTHPHYPVFTPISSR